jgi:hypothetical protein
MVETSHPLKDRLSNKMLHIWNGNHNLKTWTSYIKYNHINNIKWRFNVNNVILDGKEKNFDGLLDYLSGRFMFEEPLALECMHPTPKNQLHVMLK